MQIKNIFNRALSYIPSPLPVSVSDYNKWVDEIIELSGPYADRDSMLFAISSQVVHLDSTRSSVPKAFFVKCLRKAAANQIASQAFLDVKERQKTRAAELAAKQAAEATAQQEKAAADAKEETAGLKST